MKRKIVLLVYLCCVVVLVVMTVCLIRWEENYKGPFYSILFYSNSEQIAESPNAATDDSASAEDAKQD